MAVGPSAPPMMAMEAAAAASKPKMTAPTKVRNTPSCAAAPMSMLLGLAISGPKSVMAPMPMKMSGG